MVGVGRLEGRTVGRFGHDRLGLAGPVGRRQGGLEGRHAVGGRRRADHLELHDGARVGAEAGKRRRRAAGRRLVGIAGVVVEARVEARHRRGCVVVEDELGAGRDLGEVDDHVGALRRSEQQGVIGDVQHRDGAAEVLVADRRVGQCHRRGQEPTLVADLDHARPDGLGTGHAALAAVSRPGRGQAGARGRSDDRHLAGVGVVHRAVRLPHGSVGLGEVELQVQGAVVAGVQDAEAVGVAPDLEERIGDAVHERRVHERLGDDRRSRRARVEGPFECGRAGQRVGDRTELLRYLRRVEP